MKRRLRRSTELRTLTKPDVTPLVDLTFLLLIVFMITAPVLEYSLEIAPPELNADNIEQSENKVINLDENGIIYLENDPVSKKMMIEIISRRFAENKNLQIYIRADETRPYGEVMELMRLIRSAGISDVSLVTLAEEL